MRLIDHLVFVVNDLTHARERHRRLGFQVAPDGVHSFGTRNANIYFGNGSMIENLAVGDPQAYERAIAAGNTFVMNDAEFRQAVGDQGFSHIVASSDDAEADHAEFLRQGISGGDLVSFSRAFEQPDGRTDTFSVRLAFATHPEAPVARFFTCQTVVAPQSGHDRLSEHENGAVGVARVISCSGEPAAYGDILGCVFGADTVEAGDGEIRCAGRNGVISIMTPEAASREFGVTHDHVGAGLVHAGLVIAVGDLAAVRLLIGGNDVEAREMNDRILVDTGAGGGPFLAFEQHSHRASPDGAGREQFGSGQHWS